jgi:hypothetical protein
LRNELYLSLTDTNPDELRVTALPFDLIRDVLRDSPATNRVLILDCCFSGRAIPDLGGHDEGIIGQVGIEGTYVLTATPATAMALAPTGATYTAFTGELLTLLRTGIPDGPELLTFATIYRRLLHALTTRGLPRPGQRGTGTVDQLALTRNPAYRRHRHTTTSTADSAAPHAAPDIVDDNGVEFRGSGLRGAWGTLVPQLWIATMCGCISVTVFDAVNPFVISWTLFWTSLAIWLIIKISRTRFIVDGAGITIRYSEHNVANYPWNEFSSVEIRRQSRDLVGIPKIGSVLLGNQEFKRQWDKHDYLFIANVNSLRCSSGTLSTALVHYSNGVYRAEDSTLS